MMNKLFIITGLAAISAAFVSCSSASGDYPGSVYAPDMAYSRAYEAYGYNNLPEDHDLKSRGAYYTGTPVQGTIARGDAFGFSIPAGDSGYLQAINYPSPLQGKSLTPTQMKEAERLYLVNCGICHGAALDGNGPLWKGGDGPYPVAPRNLKDEYTKKLSDGQIYHVITYGIRQMGSYASQLRPEQRWWITSYIRSKQGSGADTTKTATADTTMKAAAVADTTKK